MMSWLRGSRCCKCRDVSSRKDFDTIKKSFNDAGYTLLESEYLNGKQKLNYICPRGHEYHTNWNIWQQGQRCPYCNGAMLHIEDIKKELALDGYTVNSDKYITGSKIKYTCNNGHEGSISMGNWRNGKRCAICYGNFKKSIEYIRPYFEAEGYNIVSGEYSNAHTKLLIKCDKGHVYKSSWHNWQSGKRCPICPSKQSKFEKEVRSYINDITDHKYITNDRTVLVNPITARRFELDLYFPNLRKAIECNGSYWHSSNKVILRDKIKKEQCVHNNIDLLVITDIQWSTDKEHTKTLIKHFLE